MKWIATTGLALAASVGGAAAPPGEPGGSARPPGVTATVGPFVGERIVRAEWARAENRRGCAPVALAEDGGAGGVPRRATFSGGWAVAFDRPGLRSAYGVAGPGQLPSDSQDADVHRLRLAEQWPHFRELGALPEPAFAGYGVEGAQPYPADDPDGSGLNSLAYVRIGGQTCTYNVWSRLGRAHLETLLDNLRMLSD
ncbi:hypothetical protein [Sphingosinicella terrae]|uniref:hypothetical protein n=1 Tax=Sphingosinicella terrae TaxID=2172047 RepID=UPI000E0CCBBF|nr:hypothetical protein [Sphingosinicella terrae]